MQGRLVLHAALVVATLTFAGCVGSTGPAPGASVLDGAPRGFSDVTWHPKAPAPGDVVTVTARANDLLANSVACHTMTVPVRHGDGGGASVTAVPTHEDGTVTCDVASRGRATELVFFLSGEAPAGDLVLSDVHRVAVQPPARQETPLSRIATFSVDGSPATAFTARLALENGAHGDASGSVHAEVAWTQFSLRPNALLSRGVPLAHEGGGVFSGVIEPDGARPDAEGVVVAYGYTEDSAGGWDMTDPVIQVHAQCVGNPLCRTP